MRAANPLARAVRLLLVLVALGCVGGLVSPWLARALTASSGAAAWAIDLVAHWQWLFLAAMVAAIALLALLGGRRWALLLLAAPLPWLSAAPPLPTSPVADGAAFTVASSNVFYRNHDPARLRAWVEEIRPDVVVMVEVSPRFARELEGPAWRDYPYRKVSPAAHAFGVAVLSRLPLEAATVWRDAEGVGVLLARIAWRGRSVMLSAFHPVPPQDIVHHRERNRVLDCLTARPEGAGRASDDAPLVVGDFNATPWSNAFAGPSSRGWRRATGLAPTWPVSWRGLMGIPIDHVLASSAWRVGGAQVGPDIGSDHRPVMARLYAEPPAADAGPLPAEGDPLVAITSCLSRAPASVRSGA